MSFLSFMQILNVYQEPKIRESWYSMFSASPLLTDWHYHTFHYTGHKNTGHTYCWNKLKKLENRCAYFHGIKLWRTRLYCMMKWRLQWPLGLALDEFYTKFRYHLGQYTTTTVILSLTCLLKYKGSFIKPCVCNKPKKIPWKSPWRYLWNWQFKCG